MKLGMYVTLILLGSAQFTWAQTTGSPDSTGMASTTASSSPTGYSVFGATAEQEMALRSQIRIMHPGVEPLRIFFVPHWKYLDNARVFHLRIPTGYGSVMFTHLPSRTIFIETNRYHGEAWLGHWIAHELGHLDTNSAKEEDAERAAREFRRRLKDSRTKDSL